MIRGVKVLGLESRNGRTYLPEALAQAARLYEDAKVNVNHPKGNPGGPRDYQDRIGTIRRVTVRAGAGLFGDFHFNPKHVLAEQLIWDAEHAPENVGFSHNVEARVARRGDRVTVEAITRVQSVDLVADPATARGLFEAAADVGTVAPAPLDAAESATVESLKRDHPALVDSILAEQADECRRLRAEVERLTAQEAVGRKREIARTLLRECGLLDAAAGQPWAQDAVSEQFLDILAAAPDESAMRTAVEDRVRLVRKLAGATLGSTGPRPQSREQDLVGAAGASGGRSFVEAIT